MPVTDCEKALDSLIQQTWKRMRTQEEINDFIRRREMILASIDEKM